MCVCVCVCVSEFLQFLNDVLNVICFNLHVIYDLFPL
jgi:hypothetical protein